MTEKELIHKIGVILGISELEVKKTPYVMLLNNLVEEFFLHVDEEIFEGNR